MYSLRLDPQDARLLKEIKVRDGIPESEQIRCAHNMKGFGPDLYLKMKRCVQILEEDASSSFS